MCVKALLTPEAIRVNNEIASLSSLLRLLSSHGAHFLSWMEAYERHKEICENS
jgi:hypothetical protein